VEDNVSDAFLLQEAFRELGANVAVEVAEDGAVALESVFEQAKEGRGPDLILLDINLPRVNGHEVLSALKDNPQTRAIPVIVLTSSCAESDIQLAYEHSANAYLTKPSSLEALLSTALHIKKFWMDVATLPR
jgi:chemotaxis family two-component system response regulator Rcp1